jgi:RNA polymerase sigma-70 factor (ECF subfamily)
MDIPDETDGIDEEDLRFQVNEVKNAIMQLPDEYRVVMTLFLLEGYDHEEISQILGISNNTSRTRYSRARQKVLGFLKEGRLKKSFSRN